MIPTRLRRIAQELQAMDKQAATNPHASLATVMAPWVATIASELLQWVHVGGALPPSRTMGNRIFQDALISVGDPFSSSGSQNVTFVFDFELEVTDGMEVTVRYGEGQRQSRMVSKIPLKTLFGTSAKELAESIWKDFIKVKL